MGISEMDNETLLKYYGDLLLDIDHKNSLKREFEREIKERRFIKGDNNNEK